MEGREEGGGEGVRERERKREREREREVVDVVRKECMVYQAGKHLSLHCLCGVWPH